MDHPSGRRSHDSIFGRVQSRQIQALAIAIHIWPQNIEDGLTRVFFERDGEEVSGAVLEASVLPAEARHADALLTIEMSDGEVVEADYDPEETAARADRAQDRFDRLSKRPPEDNS